MAVRTYDIGIDKGLLDRNIFTDEEIYQRELEQIFTRAWLLIGHESLVPNPNDFFCTYMGEDPVILTRDAKRQLHAMLNMCRHRGNRVVRADDGNAKNFMCTYHGWTYSSDGGKLVSVPGLQEAYYGELDVEHLGLIEVAKLDVCAGLVFATWDSEAPSLEDYLGDFRWYLEWMFSRRDSGMELRGPDKWIMPSNWKFPTDNFAGDTYHIPITHLAAMSAVAKAAGARSFDVAAYWDTPGGYSVATGNGHGLMTNWSDEDRVPGSSLRPSPRQRQYNEQVQSELERRLGLRAKRMGMFIASAFPNASFHPATAVRICHPRGPLHTEIWTFLLQARDAPEDIKQLGRRSGQGTFGVSGMFEVDDMNNFKQCTESGLSMVGRKYPHVLSLGLGHERTLDSLPGTVAGQWINEVPQRALYTRWQEFMNAESWADIRIDPITAQYEGTATFKG